MQGKKREKQADALGWIWMSKIRDERREKKGRKERVSRGTLLRNTIHLSAPPRPLVFRFRLRTHHYNHRRLRDILDIFIHI